MKTGEKPINDIWRAINIFWQGGPWGGLEIVVFLIFLKCLSILGNLRFQPNLYWIHLRQGTIIISRKVRKSDAVDI